MGIEIRTKKFGIIRDVKPWNYVPEEDGIEHPDNSKLVGVEDMSMVAGDGHLTDGHEASAKYLRWKLSGPDSLDVQIVGESDGGIVVFESYRHEGVDIQHAKLSRRLDSHTTENVVWTE